MWDDCLNDYGLFSIKSHVNPAAPACDRPGRSPSTRQQAVTSTLGNARFTGVPPGQITVRVKTPSGVAERQDIAVSNQEFRVNLVSP